MEDKMPPKDDNDDKMFEDFDKPPIDTIHSEPPPSKPDADMDEQAGKEYWDDSDDDGSVIDVNDYEDEPPSTATTKSAEKPGFKPLGDPTGLSSIFVTQAFNAAVRQFDKRRWLTIKIVNESEKVDLIEPHWVFKEGKSKEVPDFRIASRKEGGARFKGRKLKGALSYLIVEKGKDTGICRLVILFKVLYYRGVEVGKLVKPNTKRANRVGVTTIVKGRKYESDKKFRKLKEELWSRTNTSDVYAFLHKKYLKERLQKYREYETCSYKFDTENSGSLKDHTLNFRYAISDTGDAESKIVVFDAK